MDLGLDLKLDHDMSAEQNKNGCMLTGEIGEITIKLLQIIFCPLAGLVAGLVPIIITVRAWHVGTELEEFACGFWIGEMLKSTVIEVIHQCITISLPGEQIRFLMGDDNQYWRQVVRLWNGGIHFFEVDEEMDDQWVNAGLIGFLLEEVNTSKDIVKNGSVVLCDM